MKGHSPKPRPDVSAIAGASINLTKNLIGAGIFTLPSALRDGSVVPGLAVMLLVGLVQGSTFIMIAWLCEKLKVTTYRDAFCQAFGRKSGWIVDACIGVSGFFACVAYKILVADFLGKAFEGLFGLEGFPRWILIWVNTLLITLPLSHAKNLSPLRYTSMLGLAIIAFVATYVVRDYLCNFEASNENLVEHAFNPSMGLFKTLALCTGAFQAHYNSPRIYFELNSDLRAHSVSVISSFGLSFLVYGTFAVAGLGLFGSDVLGNVLRNYPAEGNVAVLAAWMGMAFAIIFTFPLVFTTARDSTIALVPALQRFSKKEPLQSHVLITTSMVASISATSCVVNDVSVITGLLGATIGSCLCWIFPALIYLRASAMAAQAKEPGRAPLLQRKVDPPEGLEGSRALEWYSVAMVFVGVASCCVGIAKTLRVI